MTNYTVISQRFNDEFRNGSTFATNPTTDFSYDLKGNPGERIKLTQTIEISVSVNLDETKLIQYNATSDATYGELVGTGVNWLLEGMYTGAVVNVKWAGGAYVSCTVGLITGTGYSVLRLTKANLVTAGLADGTQLTSFVVRLTSAPDTLIYKYGLNPNGFTGTNYTSWYDSNEQAYFLTNLTGSLQTMNPVGLGIISWNNSESVQAKFDATVTTYFHQFTVEHIFIIPYYKSGEYENIEDGTAPTTFIGTNTITYDNGWFFGGTTLGNYIRAEVKGGIGNVGYFKENYNGQTNNYVVENVAIANADNSGVLEGTVVNTITFQIRNTNGVNFTSNSKVIFYHSKLPTETEAQNKPTAFDTIWMRERLITTEGAGAVSGTIITNFNVTLNANPLILDVTAEIQYTGAQQLLISNTSDYLMWVSVGQGGVTAADPDDRVALPVDLNQFSKNLDVTGLINAVDVTYYEPWADFSSAVRMVTQTGWDGDLIGCVFTVVRNTATAASISKCQFKILAINSVTGDEFEFEEYRVNFPIGKLIGTTVGGVFYQVLNQNVQNSFNMPSSDLFNRITSSATVPGAPGALQSYTFKTGFQMPWREWEANPNVPTSLYNALVDQNNQNNKVSLYSNVSNWEIFPVLEVTMLTSGNVETIYRKMTFESNIYDFDTNDGTFTGTTYYYDENGDETDNIYVDQNVLIKMEFAHALGTITLGNIEAYIWIERDGSLERPWFLHSSKDWTNPLNPLEPSNTITSTNTQFVEVVSANNLITIYCKTNRDNLQDGVNYNVYGRIKNKTIA